MVPIIKRIIFVVIACLSSVLMHAQQMNTAAEEPTDVMRSNGKLYVVMAVVVVIVVGLFIYLINLDRKINKLEKGNTGQQ